MSILALHGFTGCGSDFDPFAKLCRGHWHCPNLPGHGAQPILDCAPERMVNFVQQQTTILEPPAVLFGYSMGARAALLHATAYPDFWDALILISPNPGIEDPAERTARAQSDEVLAQRIEQEGVPAFLEFWKSQPLIRSQQNIRSDWRDPMDDERSKQTAQGLANSLRQFGQAACPNLWPELSKIICPVLLITGEQDNKYCSIAERMMHSLTRAQHVVIDEAGHMPHLEAPEACVESINQFMV